MSGLWFALSCLLLTCCSSASLKEPAASSAASCPPCTPAECAALPARGCPLGKVRDSCGCCWQCARGEGEACGMGAAAAAAAAGPAVGWGRCAAGLECRRRRKGQAGVCVCKSRYPVCGTDGLTYPSACQLRAASLRSESRGERPVEQRNKGPCEQGPSIVTPPKDTWNVTGAQLFLSCEVIGVPTPVLTWNKITRGQYGVQRMELLPGDRDNLAIQTRGGPEKHEVTGWVLFPACIWDSNCKIGSTDIGCYVCRPCANVTSTYGYAESLEAPRGKISPLSKDDAGEYECHALNSKGEATASARINVVNSLQEIPTIKGESTEL